MVISTVPHESVMGEEVGPDEKLTSVTTNRHMKSQIEAKGQPSVGEGGSAFSCTEVIVYTCPALWD
jgi:hypothetical protein